jgi:rhodanese-related sulfurtransferase
MLLRPILLSLRQTSMLRPMLRPTLQHGLCGSPASGVIAAVWPKGLLQEAGGKRATVVNLDLAEELCYEVGWQARHNLLDVRPAERFEVRRPRGAHSVPYEPASTFVERAITAIDRIHLDRPAQYLSAASHARGELEPGEDDGTSMLMARLVVVGDDDSSLAMTATTALLDAGYTNTVALAAGFEEWERRGLPCETSGGVEGEEEFPDSTF